MTATQLSQVDREPLDLAARVFTLTGLTWALDPRSGRWRPLGVASTGMEWASLRYLYPDAELRLPAQHAGRVIPARRTDPATSKSAAAAIVVRAGTQRARLLAAFARDDVLDQDGATDEQAARLADGVSMSSEYAKRCSELREAGLIEPTGATRPGVSGPERIVSRITSEGSKVLTSMNA